MALLVSSLKWRPSPENENGGKKAANSHDQHHLNNISWNTRRLGSVGETLTGNGIFTVTPPERHPPFMSPDFSYPELSTLNASDGRDQGGRGHFTQLMGPTTPRNEHVFRPTFRVGGDSGPIPCTAAELHGLLLLENIKQQVNQLAGTLNIVMAKVGSGLHAPTYEMPEEFQFPLDSDGELERFEEWLHNPLNERQILCSVQMHYNECSDGCRHIPA
ncbi:hypothetical protein CgunFtcFv8_017893 [Champsocephalus gunnari]|uniref:Uncharacterized protein n=1 Tax=Champsocephalus gunnari TaxID=52237 RepID=A0AAN8DN54_CHAGU|nr:hypothetical protein CgunFtcFv8_017893 [Champsocephalus gunnari]